MVRAWRKLGSSLPVREVGGTVASLHPVDELNRIRAGQILAREGCRQEGQELWEGQSRGFF